MQYVHGSGKTVSLLQVIIIVLKIPMHPMVFDISMTIIWSTFTIEDAVVESLFLRYFVVLVTYMKITCVHRQGIPLLGRQR